MARNKAIPDGMHAKFILRDHDSQVGTAFDHITRAAGIKGLKIPYRAPRANALCERFLGRVRRECLDHMLNFGERQVFRVLREYVAYFNGARPHQGLKQQAPERTEDTSLELSATNKIILVPGLKQK